MFVVDFLHLFDRGFLLPWCCFFFSSFHSIVFYFNYLFIFLQFFSFDPVWIQFNTIINHCKSICIVSTSKNVIYLFVCSSKYADVCKQIEKIKQMFSTRTFVLCNGEGNKIKAEVVCVWEIYNLLLYFVAVWNGFKIKNDCK